MPVKIPDLRRIIERLPEPLSAVFITAPRSEPGRTSIAGSEVGVGGLMPSTPIRIPGARGARPRGFLPVPPGVPPAPALPELPEVIITPAPRSWWQQLNAWLRAPSTRAQGTVSRHVLDYYANNYMPMPGMGIGGRIPRLSRSGPSRPSRQRGFVGPTPTTLPPVELPFAPTRPRPLPVVRTEPRGNPLTVMPLPVLRPTPPPGYEYDPDEHPDLISPIQPVPLPGRTAAPAPAAVPMPSPSRTPSPGPLPTVQPFPFSTPSIVPRPQLTPQFAPVPSRIPAPYVTPVTLPRTARDLLLTGAPDLLRTLTGRPAPTRGRTTIPERTGLPASGAPTPRPDLLPLPERTLTPPKRASEDCVCDEEKKEKKPKRKKQAREVCYSGTYRERAKSLSKTKRKVIPCQ